MMMLKFQIEWATLVVGLFGHVVLSQQCYKQPNCAGVSVAVSTAKECCVGTNDGMSFADGDGNCTISQCIVHGFSNAFYDVEEGERLDMVFKVNVKGTTGFSSLLLAGNITSAAGPNTRTTDFVAFSVTTVLDNRATIPLLATKDGITLEYNDSVVFTFSLSFPGIIQVLKDAGEFLRDTATVNIIDVDLLEINFEEADYSITEGDPWPPTIRLQFRKTQNPFTMTLFSVNITEAIDPAGFNGSAFIPFDYYYEATPGDDFTDVNLTITIPPTEDKSTGIFIVPNDEMFTVIDDDINEIKQSFALVAQLGSDVPDSFTCFQRVFGDMECFGRTGVTQIIIMDNDDMIIGFSHRSQTVVDFGTGPVAILTVHSLRLSELDYEIQLLHLPSFSTAIFESYPSNYSTHYIAEFGTWEGEAMLNISLDVRDRLENSAVMLRGSLALYIETTVRFDFIEWCEGCYTIRILSPNIGFPETFDCNEDYDKQTDFFCLHTICFEENDPLIGDFVEVGYVQTAYTINENEGPVQVCVFSILTGILVEVFDFNQSIYIPSGAAVAIPDPPNLLNRTYDNIMFSDYEQQIFGFNHIRNTVFNETREIVCYNQTIYDDMRLEVSEYLGLTLTVENMSPYIDPFYSQVAIQILDNDMAVVGLERTLYMTTEDVVLVEVCVIVYSPNISCPIEFPFSVNLSTTNGTAVSPMDYIGLSTTLRFPACETQQCVNVAIIVDDLRDEPEEGFGVTLERTPELNRRIILNPVNGEILIQDNDVLVRFDPTYYTTTETKGSVTLWVGVDEAVSEPFTVALLPGERFKKSTSHYTLECNVRLHFNSSVRNLSYTYNIFPDDSCDFQYGRIRQEGVELFKVGLTLTDSTNPLVAIDFDNAEATVFIDDTMEEECITVVGYNQSVYTLFEEDGYLEMCLVVIRNGSLTPFVININTTNGTADSTKFTKNVEFLTFFNEPSNLLTEQCYNLTVISDMYCEYYSNCTSAYLLSQLTTESNFVRIENSEVHIFIEEDLTQCENINKECKTSTPDLEQNIEQTSGATAAVVIISAVVIVMLVVISVIIIYFCLKKKTSDIILNLNVDTKLEHEYATVETKESPLLQQLHKELKDKRMIVSKDQIHLKSAVGHGESGLVYKGYMDTLWGSELVAIKTGKALFSSAGDLKQLTKEISTMLSLKHPNVMSLVGVCLDGEMPILIMPFMSNGSILEYVRHHKQELLLTSEATDEEVQSAKKTYLKMCHQITKGMTYLAKEKFVHRDLAARNCMIDGHGVIKVADFGLTEDMYGTNYFRHSKSEMESEEKVPIRWMAPESIENDIYNESTDVWSFGVTIWELFTCGSVPYSGIPVMSVLKAIKGGQKLEIPQNAACSNEIYGLMTSCWNLDSHQRPKFANLQCDVSDILEAAAGYMELSCSLIWKKEEGLEDKSRTTVVAVEMIDEAEKVTAEPSTQDVPT